MIPISHFLQFFFWCLPLGWSISSQFLIIFHCINLMSFILFQCPSFLEVIAIAIPFQKALYRVVQMNQRFCPQIQKFFHQKFGRIFVKTFLSLLSFFSSHGIRLNKMYICYGNGPGTVNSWQKCIFLSKSNPQICLLFWFLGLKT